MKFFTCQEVDVFIPCLSMTKGFAVFESISLNIEIKFHL